MLLDSKTSFFLLAVVLHLAAGRKCYNTCFDVHCSQSRCLDETQEKQESACSIEKEEFEVDGEDISFRRPGFAVDDCNDEADSCVLAEFVAIRRNGVAELVTTPFGCFSNFTVISSNVINWKTEQMNVFVCDDELCNVPSLRECRDSLETEKICKVTRDQYSLTFGNVVRSGDEEDRCNFDESKFTLDEPADLNCEQFFSEEDPDEEDSNSSEEDLTNVVIIIAAAAVVLVLLMKQKFSKSQHQLGEVPIAIALAPDEAQEDPEHQEEANAGQALKSAKPEDAAEEDGPQEQLEFLSELEVKEMNEDGNADEEGTLDAGIVESLSI